MAGNPVYPFSIASGFVLERYGLTYKPKVVGFSDTAETLHKGVSLLEAQIEEQRERGAESQIKFFSHVIFSASLL